MAVWVVWYADGTSFSSEDGGPTEAPNIGVVIVVQVYEYSSVRVLHGYDFVCWQHDGTGHYEWVEHNQLGLDIYLNKPDEPGIYLTGYMVTTKRFTELYRMAVEDTRIPKKTNFQAHELAASYPPNDQQILEAMWPKD